MFKKNSLWLGILIGIIMPLLVYALLYGGYTLYNFISDKPLELDISIFQLISPVINLFFIRWYFVTKKFDDSGRGVLLVTFVYVIAYFVIN